MPLRAFIAAALLACASPGIASATLYQVIDLGTLGGVKGSGAEALNGRGVSVGYSFLAGTNFVHAIVNDHGALHDLGTLGGTQSLARAVNGAGDIVGWAYPFGLAAQRAFLWHDGSMAELGTFGGNVSDARGINDAGIIVGSAFTADPLERAFWWQSGVMHDLGTLGGSQSRAYGINQWNDIVGWAMPATDDRFHAFLSKPNSELYDLGTLGGLTSHAYDVNELTHICGWSQISPDQPASRGWIWSNGLMKSVGTLGGIYSAAFSLNNHDEVVGASTREDGTTAAFLWKNDQLFDLNALLPPGSPWSLETAADIDDQGVIAGQGRVAGVSRAFLLVPIQAGGVGEGSGPAGLRFAGAAPNPAHGATHFAFTLAAAGEVALQLFDLSGRSVRDLGRQPGAAGPGRFAWDGRDERGQWLDAGLYWARLTAGGRTIARSFVLVR